MLTISIIPRAVGRATSYTLSTRVGTCPATRVPCGRNESGLATAKALAASLADLHRASGYRVIYA